MQYYQLNSKEGPLGAPGMLFANSSKFREDMVRGQRMEQEKRSFMVGHKFISTSLLVLRKPRLWSKPVKIYKIFEYPHTD